jgi:hypothetical protein
MRFPIIFAALASATAATAATAQLPYSWSVEHVAATSQLNPSPINDRGELVQVASSNGEYALLRHGPGGTDTIVPYSTTRLTDPQINNAGDIAFLAVENGAYRLYRKLAGDAQPVPADLGDFVIGGMPFLSHAGAVSVGGRLAGVDAIVTYAGPGDVAANVRASTSSAPGQVHAFLPFAPINAARHVALVSCYGEGSDNCRDEVRAFDASGDSVLIVGLGDLAPSGDAFTNLPAYGVAINDHDEVAFTGSTSTDVGVFVGNGTTLRMGLDYTGGVQTRAGRPAFNGQGFVAIQASSPEEAVLVSDGVVRRRAVGAGDTAVVDGTTYTLNLFGDSVQMNGRGDVAFVVTLSTLERHLFVAKADGLFRDGFESVP